MPPFEALHLSVFVSRERERGLQHFRDGPPTEKRLRHARTLLEGFIGFGGLVQASHEAVDGLPHSATALLDLRVLGCLPLAVRIAPCVAVADPLGQRFGFVAGVAGEVVLELWLSRGGGRCRLCVGALLHRGRLPCAPRLDELALQAIATFLLLASLLRELPDPGAGIIARLAKGLLVARGLAIFATGR